MYIAPPSGYPTSVVFGARGQDGDLVIGMFLLGELPSLV
jgi:hypothetical protein